MYRTDKLVIRLNETERAAINRLARVEKLPTSTLARRLLLQEAERRGLLPTADPCTYDTIQGQEVSK